MAEDEVSVRIGATDNTAEGIESAKAGVDDFEDHVEAGFERVSERLLEYFAVEKITEFVKDSVQEFAKVERAMNVLGAQVRANGEDWNKAKDNVDAFVESEERLYGFTKDEIIGSISNAELKVKDLNTALAVSDAAQKLAVVSGQSLQTTTDAVSLAVQGNSRGLMELGRILGLTRDQSKDAKAVFDTLAKSISQVNSVAGDAQGSLNSLKSEFEDLSEDVGKLLATFIPILDFIVKDAREGAAQFALLNGEIDKIFSGDWSGVIQTWKDFDNQVKDIWSGTVKVAKTASLEEVALTAEAKQKEIVLQQSLLKAAKKADSDRLKAHKKMLEDEVKAEKKAAEDIKKLEAEIGRAEKKEDEEKEKKQKEKARVDAKAKKDKGKADQQAADLQLEAQTTLMDDLVSVTAVGNGKMLALNKQLRVAQALMNTYESVTQAYADYPWPFNIGIAALVAGLGAEQVAQIEGVALADGGIATRATHATIGEGGEPEAVVPLSKAADFGFGGGGDTHVHNWNFPGVTNRGEAVAAGRSAALTFIASQAKAKQRSGYRNTGY